MVVVTDALQHLILIYSYLIWLECWSFLCKYLANSVNDQQNIKLEEYLKQGMSNELSRINRK